MLKKLLVALLVSALPNLAIAWGAKKITVKTIPENAMIYVDGQEVGEGSYTVKFDKENEFYVIKAEAHGYLEKTIKLQKTNPKNSVMLRLTKDEAYEASTGSEDGAELANQWMDVTCRKGMTEEQIWKRLMNIATSYFSNIEVRDKTAGWIKTAWKPTRFDSQIIRTRLEVRMSFTGDDVITYRARISSERKLDDCEGRNCYKRYDRVLKVYEPMIEELQTAVGGGE